MRISELKQAAREQTQGNILKMFLIYLIWGLALCALMLTPLWLLSSAIGSIDFNVSQAEFFEEFQKILGTMSTASMLSALLTVLFMGFYEFGFAANFNRMYKGEPASVSASFDGFGKPGTCIGTYFVKYAYLFFWGLIPAAGVIIVLVKNYSYSCTFFLVQEGFNGGANEAVTKSREIMDGYKMKMFLLDLNYLLWYVLGIFTFGVLWIWVAPRHMQARYNLYQRIKAEQPVIN